VTAGQAALEVEIVTLFPELLDSYLASSLLGKAIAAGIIAVHRTNPRDFAAGKHRSVDDAPYGGGPGMIFRPDPLAGAIEHAEAARGRCHRIVLSPQGRLFTQTMAAELVTKRRVLLVCGRYEGIDERVVERYADDVVSIGDYVLAGGEVAASVVLEVMSRLVPGVLGSEASVLDESHVAGRLEYPQWTRPPEWRGSSVPAVLLSGDHAIVDRWRRRESLRRTMERRPDLLLSHPLSDAERALLAARFPGDEPPDDPSSAGG
jgi:tRNA (guanine37-N1)-methyltransferase